MPGFVSLIKQTIQGISRREKVFIAVAIFGSVIASVYLFVISPSFENLRLNERVVQEKKSDLLELAVMVDEYNQLAGDIKNIEKKINNKFSLFSYLEEQTNKINIRDKITYMRPKGEQTQGNYIISSIELRLKSINLKETMNLISMIERSSSHMRIKMLNMKTKFSDPNLMDVSIRVASYKVK